MNYQNGYIIYKDIDIFTIEHPNGDDASCASGKIINIYDYEFDHNITTSNGSSGCPIILNNNNKNLIQVIGIHKNGDKTMGINGGTFIGEIFNEINFETKNNFFTEAFVGNKKSESDQVHRIEQQLHAPPPIPIEVPPKSQVIVIEKETVKEIQSEYIKLKFKDKVNNQYQIEVEIKRRFNDVLNELIGKYEFLRKHKIKSVFEGERYLFLNNQSCLKTTKDLKLTNDSGFIFINLEIDEINNSINLKASKLTLKPFLKLHFFLINLENQKIDIDIPEDSIFLNALNILKNKLNLDGIIFESVFYYNRGEKIKINNETIKQTKKELNIPKNEIIFIKSKDKNYIPINVKFVWANNNYKKYEFKAGKKDKFHSVALYFLEAFEEFSNLIVKKYYLITSENKPCDSKLSQKNTNMLTTLNNISPEDIYEIEKEQEYCFLTLEALGMKKLKFILKPEYFNY